MVWMDGGYNSALRVTSCGLNVSALLEHEIMHTLLSFGCARCNRGNASRTEFHGLCMTEKAYLDFRTAVAYMYFDYFAHGTDVMANVRYFLSGGFNVTLP